jgi:hypothetical protein
MASAHDSDHDAIFGKNLRVYSSPTPPDFCALCAELNHWVVKLAASHPNLSDSAITWINEVADRAASALAHPEPMAPTDEELCKVLYQAICEFPPTNPDAVDLNADQYELELEIRKARAVLARYARPTIQPVPVSERPWEREGWCDAEGRCYGWDGNYWWMVGNPRAANETITHCLPYNALPTPEPTNT